MMTAIMDCRTVDIVKPYEAKQMNGRNGAWESKSVYFKVAVDRNYKTTTVDANGQVGKDNPTDFYLVKATGPIADVFNKYCSGRKADGKLMSRRLLLQGSFETYQNERTVTANIPNVGQYQINGIKQTNTIFVADSISFLDSAEHSGNANIANATVAQATVAVAPVAQPAPAMVAPVQAGAEVAPWA